MNDETAHTWVKLPLLWFLCMTISVVGSMFDASASDQTVQRGTALANACATCHGPEGHSTGAIPPLNTMPANALRDSLRSFRSGERSGTVMNRLTQGLDEADIDAIASYFTKRQRP